MNYKYIIYIAIIGVILRLTLLVYVNNQEYTHSFPLLELDAREYYQIGLNLAENSEFSQSESLPYEPDSFRTPIYPYLIAFSLKIFNNFYPVIFLQILLSGLLALLVYELAKKLVPSKWALLPAILLTLDPVGIVYSNLLMTETLFLILLTLSIFFFTKPDVNNKDFALTGIFLGLATLTRPISLFLIILFALLHLVYRRKLGQTILIIFSFSLIIFPWSLRNKLAFDSWSLSAVSSYNLYYYNAMRFNAYKAGTDLDQARKEFDANLTAKYGSQATLPTLTNSKIQSKEGLNIIKNDPLSYALFHFKTLIPFFFTDGLREVSELVGLTDRKYIDLRGAFFAGDLALFWTNLKNMGITGVMFIFGVVFWVLVFSFWFVGAIFGKENRFATMALFLTSATLAVLSGVVTTARFRYAISSLLLTLATYGLYKLYQKLHETIHNNPSLQRGDHN